MADAVAAEYGLAEPVDRQGPRASRAAQDVFAKDYLGEFVKCIKNA